MLCVECVSQIAKKRNCNCSYDSCTQSSDRFYILEALHITRKHVYIPTARHVTGLVVRGNHKVMWHVWLSVTGQAPLYWLCEGEKLHVACVFFALVVNNCWHHKQDEPHIITPLTQLLPHSGVSPKYRQVK